MYVFKMFLSIEEQREVLLLVVEKFGGESVVFVIDWCY